MAPKKTRKLVQETVVEETTQDLDVPPEPMREEEQDHSEDEGDRASLEEHENEEEQPKGVLFTPEQLEVLLKMNRPDFSELVEALKGGSPKSVGFKPARPGNFDGARDRKVVDAWLAKMEDYLHAAKVGRHSTVELAQSYLKGYASTWWRTVRQEKGEEPKQFQGSGFKPKANFVKKGAPFKGSQPKGVRQVRKCPWSHNLKKQRKYRA
jgi:hypothetical protein